ncbi:uncharacterized protein LOC117810015 [Notolabrus celidotus]|uniref:uncharacterized protein LOC117810015 n=1 Tax=Notolabrus celidotus TaxID=1203425 RepID=UPI00148FE548|nr:uncharacterized protein LOC117810015 [Notolabrus celidotus]
MAEMESTVEVGEILHSNTSTYTVQKFIGEGGFGKVAKCLNVNTQDQVAIKILKKDSTAAEDAEREIAMLDLISVRDPDHINVVKFLEKFQHSGQTCLVFEMLEENLYEMICKQGNMPVTAIRPVAQQLLVALDALKGLGILHTDIKPDNVMLVSQDQPIRVKLIDFGLATPVSSVELGELCQPIGCRAPEVSLGLLYNEAIDMWGLGCVLGLLYLAANPFPNTDYQVMKILIELFGQPEDHLLNAGVYTRKFFTKKDEGTDGPTWRLLTSEEYRTLTGKQLQEDEDIMKLPSSLDGLAHIFPVDEPAELKDRLAFIDLLKSMMHLDGALRISPSQALQHPFITMSHLSEHPDSSDYLTTAREMMGTPQNPDQESAAGAEEDIRDPCTCDGDIEMESTVEVGEILHSNTSTYTVQKFLGEGGFGKVAKCLNVNTQDQVAIKILKKDSTAAEDAEREIAMLDLISVRDPDHINVVKFLEKFQHSGQTCLVFEMLEENLYEMICKRGNMPVTAIRPVAQQLLVALDALKGLGILHTDIKPDNVMLVSQDQPIRVKLIDFGLATPVSSVELGELCQPIGCRAPEVSLGLLYNEAIDMWGLGCVLGFLYLAANPFPNTDYQVMKILIELFGQPEDHLLNAGVYTRNFFTKKDEGTDGPTWRLLTSEEYETLTGKKLRENENIMKLPSSLDGLAHIFPVDEPADLEDRLAFIDLLKSMMHLDGALRISPSQALQHPFITMSHLSEHPDSSDYLTTAREMMGTPQNPDQESAAGAEEDVRDPCTFDGNIEMESTVQVREQGKSYNNVPETQSCDGAQAEDSPREMESTVQVGEKEDSYNNVPETQSCDGAQAQSYDNISMSGSSEGELPSWMFNKEEDDPFPVGAEQTESAPPPSTSPSHFNRAMKRIRRFFKRVKTTFCCCCPVEDD